jgi:hypothetical protein
VSVSRSALCVALSGVAAGSIAVGSVAHGQDRVEPAGPRIVLDYGIGFEVDTNDPLEDPSPGTYAALVNQFDVAFLSNTRTQSLALTFSGDLNLADDPPEDEIQFEFRDPTVGLSYSREAANARLAVSGSVRVRDVDTLEPFFIDTDGDTIVDEAGFTEDDGTATQVDFGVTLETRRNAPISTTYSASYSARTFTDTDDPDLYDREDFRLGTTTRLRFSDVTEGRLRLSARRYEYSEGRDLVGDSYSVTAGVVHDLSPILTVEAGVGYAYTREEEEFDGVSVEDSDEGLVFDAGFRREVARGEYFGEYDRELVEDTFRNTLVFGRSIALQNSDIRGGLGFTNLDGGDPQPVFNVLYSRETGDGRFTAGLRRTVTINTDDEERATITASYNRALTQDWGLTVGYRGRTKTTESDDAVSNAVFVNLGRRFIFRP